MYIFALFFVIFLSNNISVIWSLFSCIPLYNFSYTYDYIMSTSTSFVDRSVVQSLNKCVHLSSPSHMHARMQTQIQIMLGVCMYFLCGWMSLISFFFHTLAEVGWFKLLLRYAWCIIRSLHISYWSRY